MNDIISNSAFLSLLTCSDFGTKLNLPLFTDDDSVLEKSFFPFTLLNAKDPLFKLIKGEILTDTGCCLQTIFLLIQNDNYNFVNNELQPLNNQLIDQEFKNTFSFYNSKETDHVSPFFADQIGAEGDLKPLAPIFFCKLKKTYFHPVCPECGQILSLCYDDKLLVSQGLQAYSSSLKRYLFCPACFAEQNQSDFYVPELKADDPSFLKTRIDLINGIGALKDRIEANSAIYCLNCELYQECYQSNDFAQANDLAQARIAALSFFPFYMLLFPRQSIPAMEFLALLSGADFEELESNLRETGKSFQLDYVKKNKNDFSGKDRFLFKGRPNFFEEVLYLKLAFLGDLAKTYFSHPLLLHNSHANFDIERVWVRLFSQNSLLPSFWNFKTRILGLGISDGHSALMHPLPSCIYFDFGRLWFLALLMNPKQGANLIYQEVEKALDFVKANDDKAFKEYLQEGFKGVLAPDNIFWDSTKIADPIADDQLDLWQKALGMGFYLLEAGLQISSDTLSESLPESLMDDFFQELEELKKAVKDKLFNDQPVGGIRSKNEISLRTKEDRRLIDILGNIMDSWKKSSDGTEKKVDICETVVLKPSPVIDIDSSEEALETVILNKSAKVPVVPDSGPIDLMEETVILSSSTGTPPVNQPKDQPEDQNAEQNADEPMTETIVLRPDK